MDEQKKAVGPVPVGEAAGELSRFVDSYASFSRIINSLQRQYIELKEEFSEQNSMLSATNQKLVDMTRRNLSATEFLNNILTSISAGVIAVDPNGRITHFNPAASMMLGIPADDARGKHYREVVPPGQPIEANALRAVETGKPVESVEKRISLMDGTRLHLSVSTAILHDSEGKSLGAVEVFHDLTRIKQMEQEFARLNTLAALGEMAATVAHEVRNPLAGIGGFAALLKRDLAQDDARQKLVDKIIRGVESLNKTVTTLLNYTRFEDVNREDVVLEEFLRRTVEQFRHDYGEKLRDSEFVLEAPHDRAGAIVIRVDQMLVRQLLYNLFTNAVESTGSKTEIEIRYRKLPRQTAIERYALRLLIGLDETVVEITVSDNGPGIPVDNLPRVFAPFFTTKQDGNGLGLAVCWKIAKAHGGDIVAENSREGGAAMTLLIPTKIDHVTIEQMV
jgi:PAS domain S-box-containing protein